jgi:hypothetical protein
LIDNSKMAESRTATIIETKKTANSYSNCVTGDV